MKVSWATAAFLTAAHLTAGGAVVSADTTPAGGVAPPGARTFTGRHGTGMWGQCSSGVPLDRVVAQAKAEQWSRIQTVLSGVHTATSPSFACELAYDFAHSCPAWDPNVPAVEAQVCALALRRDLEVEEARLKDSTGQSNLGEVQAVAWPTPRRPGEVFVAPAKGFRVSLARVESLRPLTGDPDKVFRDANAFLTDSLRFDGDMSRLGDSCADLAQLGNATSEVGDLTAGRYRQLVAERRKAHLVTIGREIAKRTFMPSLRNTADLDVLSGSIEVTKSLAQQSVCYDGTAGAELVTRVDAWSTKLSLGIDEEKKCRTSAQCMRARKEEDEKAAAASMVEDICAVVADRRDAARQIQVERSNPGGVVDLETLHDLGQKIQFDDANLAQLRAQYAAVAHRPFNDATCPR